MKLLLVLMLCAVAAAAPKVLKLESFQQNDLANNELADEQNRSLMVNALVRQLFTYLRFIINNGSNIFGFGPLDPLDLDSYHLEIPAGLLNLDLHLKKIHVSGLGDFVVNKGDLDLRTMTFDIDITIPILNIRADEYDLTGDVYTAIPLYGKGKAHFVVEGFRFQAVLHLMQSEDLKSVLIERVESPSFDIPSLKSTLTGVIGGGDIDAIVNAMIEEVVIDYVLRFRGAISLIVAAQVPGALNKPLSKVDTWKYIAPLIPRS